MTLRKTFTAAGWTLAGALILAAGTLLPAAPASAHYIEEAEPGEDGYLDADCHDVSTGNADAIRVGSTLYEGTAINSNAVIDSVEDAAPNGHAQHSNNRAVGKDGNVQEVSEVDEHYHATTERSYKCWLRSVLSIPRVVWILRTAGGVLAAFGLLKIVGNRMKVVPGTKNSGGLPMVIGGVLLILADVLLVPIIFTITDLVEQIFEATAGIL